MIYIIDDDKNVRRGFKILLKSAELESSDFESANDFLKSWKPAKNDLLILDIQMHGMTGCDLLKYFIEKHIHVPVIIVTAYDDPVSREISKNYGVLAYLRKPIDGEALIDLIQFAVKAN